jgi:hypothetical protein
MLEGVQILDQGTALGFTAPSGATGPTALYAAGPVGGARLERAFTFTAPPTIEEIIPRVVNAGTRVRVQGLRLSTVAQLWLGGRALPILDKLPGELAFLVPEGLPPGPLTLRLEGPWGGATAPGGLELLDAPWQGDPQVLRVDPPFLPLEGGRLQVSACALASEPAPTFLLGAVPGLLLDHPVGSCTWLLHFPAFGGPGVLRLEIQSSQGPLQGPEVVIFQKPELTALLPSEGPLQGLPQVLLSGQALDGVTAVHVGARSAPILERGPQRLLVAMPDGGPGKRTLRLTTAYGEWAFRDLWTYLPANPALVSVTPGDASLAGGTLVELRGAGLGAGLRVFFGDLEADLEYQSGDSLALVRTPAVPIPGDLALRLEAPSGELRWAAPFNFFDPTDWNSGGLWGGTLEGDLNLAVLDNRDWDPVPGATVLVSCPSFSGWRTGLTDDRGLLTISEAGLRGPCSVHVSRLGSEASSVVGTSARNATLFLTVPKPTGPGGGGTDPPADGLVKVSLLDARKYSQAPAGDCSTYPKTDAFCLPCLDNPDCPEGSQCVPFGRTGTYCSLPCGADQDCPDRARCAGLGNRGRFCILAAGEAGVRCFFSQDGPYASSLALAPALPLEDETLNLELVASPGERALVCFLGYTDFVSGRFVPQTLALRRHLTVYPGAKVTLPPLVPEHRLDGRLLVHLPDPPRPPNALSSILAFIELGSDGFIPLPSSAQEAAGTSLELTSLPLAFEGSLEGASLLVQGAVWEGSLDALPVSRIQRTLPRPDPGASLVAVQGGKALPQAEAPPGALRTVARLGEALVFAGDGGEALWLFPGGSARRQLLPVDGSMVASAVAGQVLYLGGASGALVALESQGEARLLGSLFGGPVVALAGNPAGRLVAAGEGQLAEFRDGELTGRTRVALMVRALGFLGQELLVLAEDGGVFARTPSLEWQALPKAPCVGQRLGALDDGTLLLTGRDCVALLLQDGTWLDPGAPAGNWQAGTGASAQALWLVDLKGRVVGLAGGLWQELTQVAGQRPLVAVLDGAQALLVAGAPGLSFHPMMGMPEFLSPLAGQAWDQQHLSWTNGQEGAEDSFNLLYLEDPYGRTIWRITSAGGVHDFTLPDFSSQGFSPLAAKAAGLRIYSVRKEDHDFRRFNLYDFNTRLWGAWAYEDLGFR